MDYRSVQKTGSTGTNLQSAKPVLVRSNAKDVLLPSDPTSCVIVTPDLNISGSKSNAWRSSNRDSVRDYTVKQLATLQVSRKELLPAFYELPNEVLVHILYYLDVGDLLSLSRVSYLLSPCDFVFICYISDRLAKLYFTFRMLVRTIASAITILFMHIPNT